MNNILLYFFIITTAQTAFAKAKIELWEVGESTLEFSYHQDVLISSYCLTHKCMAKTFLEDKSKIKINWKGELDGGKNPAAVICQKSANGIVVRARRIGGQTQNSFCEFQDTSMLSLSSVMRRVQ